MARYVAALALAIVSLMALPSSGLAAVLGGDQTVERTVDQNLAGNAEAIQMTASASGTAGTVSVYVDATSTATTLVAGIYADSGGHPGTLLTQGSKSAPTAAAWNDVAVPPVSIVSGASYWIGILAPSGTLKFRIKSAGKAESPTASGLSALPATWTTRVVLRRHGIRLRAVGHRHRTRAGGGSAQPRLQRAGRRLGRSLAVGVASRTPATGTLSYSAVSDAALADRRARRGQRPGHAERVREPRRPRARRLHGPRDDHRAASGERIAAGRDRDVQRRPAVVSQADRPTG